MITVLLLLLAQGRVYHDVPLEKVAVTRWTHVTTCGLVTYARTLADGDRHVTLTRGKDFVVLEIIPLIPLASPKKNQVIEAWGIVRIDRGHRTARYPEGWPELHPVENWRAVVACRF